MVLTQNQTAQPVHQRGVASVLLLFAMSAFSVIGIATLAKYVGVQQSGSIFTLFRGVEDRSTTRFVAPIVVPNSWRVQESGGTYAFQLPVLVPENGNEDTGSTAVWHSMSDSEVPGMAVCCESRAGICSNRNRANGVAEIVDWTPGSDDAQWLSLKLGSQPDADAKSDLITATVLAAAATANPDGTPIACQLEFKGTVIAKGMAHLRQVPRQDGLNLPTDTVEGSFDIAVRTK